MIAVRQALARRADRWLVAAIVVGFVLRVGWVLHAAQPPPRLTDPWQYQQMALGLSRADLPSIGDRPSAFFPPGYPMVLTPLAWLSERTGLSLSLAAGLFNAVAGTATIALVAELAGRWMGARARVPAAWIMAVAAGPIYLTAVSLSETWFTALLLLGAVLVTRAADRRWTVRRGVVVGVLIGYLSLVRTPGLLLLVMILLAQRATQGRWRGAGRPLLAATVGCLLVLVPWTVRNGRQVGVWSPMSTNNVAFLCLGNGAGADGHLYVDEAESERCFRGSPMDNPVIYEPGEVPGDFPFTQPDEPGWYRATLSATVKNMVRHPLDQPGFFVRKTFDTFGADNQALNDAQGFGRQPVVGEHTRDLLTMLANIWHWGVLALFALALGYLPRARSALPLWGLAALLYLSIMAGIGLHRYHHPIMALCVVFAAGVVGQLGERAPEGES